MTAPTLEPRTGEPARSGPGERLLALALRTLHLIAVVALGAALLGAPVARTASGVAVLASGVLLLVLDLLARRIALNEAAGVVVLVKLAGVAWIAFNQSGAQALFWVILGLSTLAAHAPKRWRHWPRGD